MLFAFLMIVFGDIPAISMLIHMKGHNAILPCRLCEIRGVRTPGTNVTTHYVPLNREHFPRNVQPRKYDPLNLPLRTHEEFMRQAKEVDFAINKAESERLAKFYGIKGMPALSVLSTLSFPRSFPYDFMHLIWANLIPNLILFWTGTFKALDHGNEGYFLTTDVWKAIGKATAAAGRTIPAAFGAPVPNLSLNGAHMTCETYSIWTLYYAPILLRGRFVKTRYYNHFVDLVQLLSLCLQFTITEEEINYLEKGFQKWVQKYELCVF